MALQIKHTDAAGNTYPAAYAKADEPIISRGRFPGQAGGRIPVFIYRDQAARDDAELAYVCYVEVPLSAEAVESYFTAPGDRRQQAYTYMKTQTEWEGAANV